jgi:hypothetical protein
MRNYCYKVYLKYSALAYRFIERMSLTKRLEKEDSKPVKKAAVAMLAVAFLVSFLASISVASSTISVAANNNNSKGSEFSLAVNGTIQSSKTVNLHLGVVGSASIYCEVYTITNMGKSPITVTATTSVYPSQAATLNLHGGPAVTLDAGKSYAMTLIVTDFSQSGVVSLTFSSV